MNENQLKWDRRFLELAKLVSTWSKDPSTQTGAVIVDGRRVVSIGYNGLPLGVEDTHERLHNREIKYQMVVHCERNAMLFARQSLEGCTLYTYPFLSCSVCAGMVIQSGIKRCVSPVMSEDIASRWAKSLELTYQMYKEAGVEWIEL